MRVKKDDLRHLRSLVNQNADVDFSLGFYIKCWIFAAPFKQDSSQFYFLQKKKINKTKQHNLLWCSTYPEIFTVGI